MPTGSANRSTVTLPALVESLAGGIHRDALLPGQVGDRPCQPQAAVPAPSAEAELAVALLEGLASFAIELSMASQRARGHVRVGPARAEALLLVPPRRDHPLTDGSRVLCLFLDQLLSRRRVDGQGDVDAIGERAAQLRLVAGHGGRMALA